MRQVSRSAWFPATGPAVLDALRPSWHAMAVPALTVDDIGDATAYYRTVLGFEHVRTAGAAIAVVRGHGVTLQLCQQPNGKRAGEQAGGACWRGAPDAVLLVDRPQVLRRQWEDQRAQVVPPEDLEPEWAGFFGLTDGFGNMLAVGPVSGPVAAAKRLAGKPAEDMVIRLHERRRARAEAPHVAELRAFYEKLSDKRDIYYMLFSGRLLHWMVRALSRVPRDVNLVLLGSDLPPDELTWVRQHLDRPFHHIGLRVDDQVAWEFLFAVNRHHFGWIDSDCFVLNGNLFGELADIAPGVSMNCAWSWDSGCGFPVANTYLLFVNVDVIAALRKRGLAASPSPYDYERQNLGVPSRRCYARRPSRAQRRRLRRILARDEAGRPAPPGGMAYFDTTVMHQLLARSCGWPVHRVRSLEGFRHLRGLAVQDEASDELLHVGAVARADPLDEQSGYFHDSGVRLLYLAAEYINLDELAGQLPPYYTDRLERITSALAARGITPDAARELIREHLVEARGMSDQGAAAVLRPAANIEEFR